MNDDDRTFQEIIDELRRHPDLANQDTLIDALALAYAQLCRLSPRQAEAVLTMLRQYEFTPTQESRLP